MILIEKNTDVCEIGAKAHTLFSLGIPDTPPLFTVPAGFFSQRESDPALNDELASELEQRLDSTKLYAVRSSAIDEDSAHASFAGIHDSFLNVQKADVLACIEKVYQSAFSQRAAEYRKVNSLDSTDIRIAVIIQEMVPAEISGVAFTINPVTDNPDETVISVTRGLGERLVDGSVSGTTYLINGRDTKIIGEDILSKKQLNAVLKLINTVAQRTDSFQDIEFAVVGDKAYFLQARPIAAYEGINPHERTLLIDNSNIIESYYGVTSPLTFTFAKDVYREVYTSTLKCGRVRRSVLRELEPSLSEMLYCHEGKIYYNMNSWYHVNSVFPSKKTSSRMEGMMGVKSSTSRFKRLKLNLFDMLKLGAILLWKIMNLSSLSDRFEERFNRIVLPYYGRRIDGTNEGLYRLFCDIENKIVKEFVVPIINDCAVMIYFGRLTERAKKLGISKEKLNRLISNDGKVRSVGSATGLMDIVKRVRSDQQMLSDFTLLSPEELMAKYKESSVLSELLNSYLLEFGARVCDELKLETVTMIEDPLMLYRAIKDNIDVVSSFSACEPEPLPKKLKRLGNKTKRFIQNRERLRLKRTYVYSVVRNIFLAYGRNYCAEGRIDDPKDIFYLTKQEVFSGSGDLRQLVEERKLEAEENRSKPTYDRVVFYGDRMLRVKHSAQSGTLSGIPTGAGTVTARVRLMNSLKDTLLPGEIILTKRTDPGWISLFSRAGGLIVEHGSMLSHSFVVAREMNLPAVVGIEDATERIPDGATVTLDGIRGVVTVADK